MKSIFLLFLLFFAISSFARDISLPDVLVEDDEIFFG